MFNVWTFLAGLGMFLFGMFLMEDSIKLLAGRSLKNLIRRFTGTRARALLTGTATTAVLQSSSAVSLMALAFVGAGILTLGNAIATLLGAMVGTTMTAWLVAFFGFSVKIDSFSLPLVGLGGLGMALLGRSQRYVNISKLAFALGILFMGLDYMKTATEALAARADLAVLPDLGLWVYALAGLALTAVMQSSSAAIAVVLTAIFGGLLDFRQGAGMVIGANVGTAVTILMGAIGGVPAKKQTALGALALKAGTALVVLPALPLMFWAVGLFVSPEKNPTLALAAFHTLFNLVAVALFYPAIPALTRRLEGLFSEKRAVLTRFIHNTSPQVPEAALPALRGEVLNQLGLSLGYIADRYGLTAPASPAVQGPDGLQYPDLERLHAEIFAFYSRVMTQEMDEAEAVQLDPVIRASRSVMNAASNFFELRAETEDLAGDENPFLAESAKDLVGRLASLRSLTDRLVREPDSASAGTDLDAFFRRAEEADRRFIASCAGAVAAGVIRESEVTRLLMLNRFFTQSIRMLVLSLRGLTSDFASPPGAEARDAGEARGSGKEAPAETKPWAQP